ncbi:hypothetical protein [Flavobacterium hydrophilum]|uniref:Uncharacterized protein n=1 Tax=Flavobacterium hydrophilum TaxID=2211445 RepID=A0A2V4C3K4_9FLAO|nr:hypothetical protein [Flavobacterium hydrophilum]PXY44490.1 hypothetical protein DMB68_13560 [Flavobacterium hydrophilum]
MKTKTIELAEDYLMNLLKNGCETKEDLILAFWFYWVDSVTMNAAEFQKVVSSSSVNKWFIIELSKEETVFKEFIKEYPDTKGKDKDWLYCKCISKLMNHFPKALLEEAKKRQKIHARESGIQVFRPTQN